MYISIHKCYDICVYFHSQVLWSYKKNLTSDDRFEYAAAEVCKEELQNVMYFLMYIQWWIQDSMLDGPQ